MAVKQKSNSDVGESDPETTDDDATEVDFVTMTQDGETLDVHPDCVSAHHAAGWRTA